MDIISPGSKVKIHSDVTGIVTDVLIQGDPHIIISYKVSWWNGRARCHEWFNNFEVEIDSGSTTSIGFK